MVCRSRMQIFFLANVGEPLRQMSNRMQAKKQWDKRNQRGRGASIAPPPSDNFNFSAFKIDSLRYWWFWGRAFMNRSHFVSLFQLQHLIISPSNFQCDQIKKIPNFNLQTSQGWPLWLDIICKVSSTYFLMVSSPLGFLICTPHRLNASLPKKKGWMAAVWECHFMFLLCSLCQ